MSCTSHDADVYHGLSETINWLIHMRDVMQLLVAFGLFMAFLCLGMMVAAGLAVGFARIGLESMTYPVFGCGLGLNLLVSFLFAGAAAKRITGACQERQ